MFSTSVGRVVRSTCAACSQPTLLTARSIAAASKPLAQRSHQRRQSSSKASIPPDGARRSTPSTQQTSNSSARVGRRKSKHVSSTTAPVEKQNQTFAKQYPNLPRVESTSHLLPKGSSPLNHPCNPSSNESRCEHLFLLLPPPPHLGNTLRPSSGNPNLLLLHLRVPPDPKQAPRRHHHPLQLRRKPRAATEPLRRCLANQRPRGQAARRHHTTEHLSRQSRCAIPTFQTSARAFAVSPKR